jgi:hypothetical protein
MSDITPCAASLIFVSAYCASPSTPEMPAPPYTLGWVYNLETAPSESDARGIIALAVIFPLLAVLCVGLKFRIRIKTIGSVGWDDIALAISCVCTIR